MPNDRFYKNTSSPSRPNFILRFSRIMVFLLSYSIKTTDKREQYNWIAENNLNGFGRRFSFKSKRSGGRKSRPGRKLLVVISKYIS